jgi:CheY-like chemotaxis protein
MVKNVNTILLIDDDLAINFLHKRVLTKLAVGETIVSLYNGAEAINEVRSLNNSLTEDDLVLIFLDINMPVMDGWGFLENFKTIYKELKFQCKIIVLSSSINPDDIQKARSNTFVSDYFSKPLRIDSVEAIKEKYL